jgi:hypothetical protein
MILFPYPNESLFPRQVAVTLFLTGYNKMNDFLCNRFTSFFKVETDILIDPAVDISIGFRDNEHG